MENDKERMVNYKKDFLRFFKEFGFLKKFFKVIPDRLGKYYVLTGNNGQVVKKIEIIKKPSPIINMLYEISDFDDKNGFFRNKHYLSESMLLILSALCDIFNSNYDLIKTFGFKENGEYDNIIISYIITFMFITEVYCKYFSVSNVLYEYNYCKIKTYFKSEEYYTVLRPFIERAFPQKVLNDKGYYGKRI